METTTPTITGREVRELFGDLSLETYYGYNMRIVLMRQDPKFLRALGSFIEECEKARRAGK